MNRFFGSILTIIAVLFSVNIHACQSDTNTQHIFHLFEEDSHICVESFDVCCEHPECEMDDESEDGEPEPQDDACPVGKRFIREMMDMCIPHVRQAIYTVSVQKLLYAETSVTQHPPKPAYYNFIFRYRPF